MAAHARAVLEFGYARDPGRADFSQYFVFSRDLVTKRKGQTFEADSIFYDADARPYLHIEVKAEPAAIRRMAQVIDAYQELHRLPTRVLKEVEYVLDLVPKYLWLVGPGTVDPEMHVWRVDGTTMERMLFERMKCLPVAPAH